MMEDKLSIAREAMAVNRTPTKVYVLLTVISTSVTDS